MLDTHPNVENFRQRAGYVCINGLTGGLTDERLAIEQDELVDRANHSPTMCTLVAPRL